MAHRQPAIDVGGTTEFRNFFNALDSTDPLRQEIRDAQDVLLQDCTSGDKIQHDRWPDIYVQQYEITNLWRYPLQSGWRLVYTILGHANGFLVSMIEAFSHQDYERRFEY